MLTIVSNIGSVDLLRLRDRVVTAACFNGVIGDYPWDRWEVAALEAGVSKPLASLGRSVFREAFQHDWANELKVECGWLDGGAEMILYAIAVPGEIEERWRELIESDGVPNDYELAGSGVFSHCFVLLKSFQARQITVFPLFSRCGCFS